jgi:hypothetical protein
MGLGLIFPHDDSTHQLEDGHPTSFRDLDETNEPHFIGGDIATPHQPIEGSDRNVLAILKFRSISDFIATFGTNAPLKTGVPDFLHA